MEKRNEKKILKSIEEIDTIVTELEISKGRGNIILCVVNSILYREKIINLLRSHFNVEVIKIKNGNQIIEILKNEIERDADVLVWLTPEEPKKDILNALNNFRELFYRIRVPSLIFINYAFLEKIIKEAPDFWRYRGNIYEIEFRDEVSSYALEILTAPLTYESKEDLLRRKRIHEEMLKKVKNERLKFDILNQLGIIYDYLGNSDKALEFFNEALKIAEKLDEKSYIVICYINLGYIYKVKGNLNKALRYTEKALNLSMKIDYLDGIITSLLNIGVIYMEKRNFKKALDFFEKALKLTKDLEDSKDILAMLYVNIGNVYNKFEKVDKALEYYEKALKISRKIKNKEVIAVVYIGIGNIYFNMGAFKKSLYYYRKALKINKELGRKRGIAISYLNIGNLYFVKGDLSKALEYYKKALNIFKSIGDKLNFVKTLVSIGNVYLEKGDENKALKHYLEAKKLAKGKLLRKVEERIKELKKF